MKLINRLTKIFILLSLISPVQSKTIIADGSYMDLDLSGRDGHDGQRGKQCELGEDGEDGRNGYDIVVKYSHLSDLRDIKVDQSGGEGGRAGERGSIFNCDDLPLGRAQDGRDGVFGSITLLEANNLPRKELSHHSLSLNEAHGKSLLFIRNNFKTNKGAKALFHPESKIRDSYTTFTGQVQKKLNLSVSPKLMNSKSLKLSLSYGAYEGSTPLLNIRDTEKNEGLLVKSHFDKGTKTVAINDVYYRNDLLDFSFVEVLGNHVTTEIVLKNAKEEFSLEKMKTSFSFKFYRYHSFLDRYIIVGTYNSDYMPVKRKGDLYYINIGASKTLRAELNSGAKHKVIISAHKHLGKSSIGQRFEEIIDID